MPATFAESPEFQRLLRADPGADVVRIALEIARDAYPALDPRPYEARLEALAARVRDRCATIDRPRQVLGQINWVLFVEEGFQGNTRDYDDPRNSYLNEVLDRKTGIPISLCLVYIRLARRLGLTVAGLNLPAHFMLGVGAGEGPATIIVDPFHDGALYDRKGCQARIAQQVGRPLTLTDEDFAPCPTAVMVARMLRNLKAIYLRSHDYPAAVPVQRRLAALNAHDPDEQRDLGMLYLRLDRPAEAVEPLQNYLDAHPPSSARDEIRDLLRGAQRDQALRN